RKAQSLKMVPCKIQLRSYLTRCMQLKTPKLLKKRSLPQEAQLYPKNYKLTSPQGTKELKYAPKLILAVNRKRRTQTTYRGNITGPTRMYFKRWGSLAPPPGKVSFPKICLPCFSHKDTIPH